MYTVFEEDNQKPKMYDLTLGKFNTLKEAEEFAQYRFNAGTEDIFIADSDEYEEGNYNYIK